MYVVPVNVQVSFAKWVVSSVSAVRLSKCGLDRSSWSELESESERKVNFTWKLWVEFVFQYFFHRAIASTNRGGREAEAGGRLHCYKNNFIEQQELS